MLKLKVKKKHWKGKVESELNPLNRSFIFTELSCEKQNFGTSLSIILRRFYEQYPDESPMQLNFVHSYNILYIFYPDFTDLFSWDS